MEGLPATPTPLDVGVSYQHRTVPTQSRRIQAPPLRGAEGEAGMMRRHRLHPLLILLLWLAAAYVVIGAGPAFVPFMGPPERPEAVLWKMFGAGLFLAASFWLLRRDPGGASVLGLGLTPRRMTLLAASIVGGFAVVGLCFLILRTMVAFHFEPGSLALTGALTASLTYLCGALLEELAFRGHALLRLRERYGPIVAVAAVSLAFGLLHLPGLQGMGVVKMIVTTGLSSVLFAVAYLRSRTLWTAVGLHMGMNVMLHVILGGGGEAKASLMKAMFDRPPPGFDAGFWSLVFVLALFTVALLLLWPRPVRTG